MLHWYWILCLSLFTLQNIEINVMVPCINSSGINVQVWGSRKGLQTSECHGCALRGLQTRERRELRVCLVLLFSTSLFPEQRECRWNTWNRNSWFFLVMDFISLWIKKKKKKEDSVKQKYWHGSHRSGKDRHLRESICSFSPYSLSFGGSFMWLRILIYVLNTMEMFENGLRFLLLLILMSCFQFCS